MGKLNAAAVAKIDEICARYKDERTPLMMILSDIQNEYGYIPLEVQEIVSKHTGDLRGCYILFILFTHSKGEIRYRLLSRNSVLCQGSPAGH